MTSTAWNKTRANWFATAIVLVTAFCPTASAWADSLVYTVTVNTSAIGGTSGYLDLQFNPGTLPGTQLATATIQGFASDGTLGTDLPSGDVTGTLPMTLSFDNQTGFNDDFQSIVFGNALHFTLTLSGPAVLTPDGLSTSGSTFGIGLYDSTGFDPLLTSDPNGFVGILNLNLDGTGTPTTYQTDTGGTPVVTFTLEGLSPSPTPEPGSIVLLGTGLAAMVGYVRRWAFAGHDTHFRS